MHDLLYVKRTIVCPLGLHEAYNYAQCHASDTPGIGIC